MTTSRENREQYVLISNGTRTEWGPIRSVSQSEGRTGGTCILVMRD